MQVQVSCRFLDVGKIVKKDTGEVFEQLHAYDGTQRLLTPFLSQEQTKEFSSMKFGDQITLNMEIWQGQKGMGQRVIGLVK